MKYILNKEYRLCGWKNMPYALMNTEKNVTIAVSEKVFELLFQCSGKRDIPSEDLSEEKQKIFKELLEKHIIRAVGDGETRTLAYYDYQGLYKKSVQWSVTGKCNYNCKHCFQSAPQGVLGEPTLEQCLDIIHQLNECGIRQVNITGGEPLIRRDFFDILDEISKYGMSVGTIFSNGRLVTDEFLDRLEERNLHPSFQISFDGVGYHDWMRGMKGAERDALAAFERLRNRGFSASSAMCLCRENVSAIRPTVLKLAEVGCRFMKFQRCMPMGEWKDQREHFLTYEETLQAYLDYLPLYKADGMPIDIQMEGYFVYEKGKGYLNYSDRNGKEELLAVTPPCGVIKSSFFIGPNGTVAPCMSMNGSAMEAQLPNVFETSLKDILTESNYTKLTAYSVKDIYDHNEKCRDCKYRCRCCTGCRAFAVGDEGTDYLAIDPVTCKILTEGWSDKLEEIAGKLFEKYNIGVEKEPNVRKDC